MKKYVPFTTVCIDDERGSNWLTEYDEDEYYTSIKDAECALEEMKVDSDGAYGLFVYEGDKRVDEIIYSGDDDYPEDDYYEDWDNLEVGFNPYMGCYDFDC